MYHFGMKTRMHAKDERTSKVYVFANKSNGKEESAVKKLASAIFGQ